jgi:hypothetical protein
MKSHTFLTLLLLAAWAVSSPSRASTDAPASDDPSQTALTITADYYPGETFLLKIEMSSNHEILSVHFISPDGDQPYTLEQLKQGFQPLFEKFGIPVVELRIDSMATDHSAEIEIRYRTSPVSHAHQYFNVEYNGSDYEILDEKFIPAKVIHSARVLTKPTIFGVPTGIAAIVTH